MEESRQLFNEELAKFSHFHKRLLEEEQYLFEEKAWTFFNTKQFIAEGFPEVSFRMKLIVSSYVAQLLFGFDNINLVHFHTIVMHPSAYISDKLGVLVRGETRSGGTIHLSWLDLAEGHNNHKNGVNLALHEFTHALDLENMMGPEEIHFMDAQSLLAFTKIAETEIELMRNGKHHFFRQYAASNTREFFAVSVENFFERSVDMERELPHVFESLVRLLNLNPCERIVRVEA